VFFYAIQLVIGVGVGIISGALGLGGGILMVPAFLTFIPHMETHTAKGTSLFIIIFVAALNAWRYYRHQERWPWELAGWLAAGSIVGSYLGAWVTAIMPEPVVLAVFIIFLVMLTARTYLLEAKPVSASPIEGNRILILVIGAVAGLFGGATGTGGGSVLIPLALMAGIAANNNVVGLSNLVMVATAIAGTVAHLRAERIYPLDPTFGHIYLAIVPLVFIGAQLGSSLGHRLNDRLTLRARKRLMAALLLTIGARLLYRFYEMNQ
jgi:uncharacterized membrane protein YfcA